jgi:hypothetical protein
MDMRRAVQRASNTLSDSNLDVQHNPNRLRDEGARVVVGRGLGVDVEQALRLAEHLGKADAALLRAVLEQGRPLTEIALLGGLDERALSRRVRGLLRRVSSPAFAMCVLYAGAWPEPLGRVARACVLEGQTIREAARTLGLSVHRVRTARAAVEAMVQGVRAMNATGRGEGAWGRAGVRVGAVGGMGVVEGSEGSGGRWRRSA